MPAIYFLIPRGRPSSFREIGTVVLAMGGGESARAKGGAWERVVEV